ncbi:hypothetical protein I5677_15545 [Mobilitalea sibirica]|uniref:Uncharacterized protein n=1 Tax=Mobilitalea sibirica TaxID=1462919 RepID=A0A8J7H4I8_9FIRM|nr:hypothetical protein [Mobilitalea sibirica]MBH1942315.1 hypothetical protein [Mobilitalea sibirica]
MKSMKRSSIRKRRNRIKENKSKNVYIVLTQTQTYPARAIHLYTNEPYAHASIAFDEDLEEMYSFARRGIWNPFNAGFIEEDINHGIFGKFRSTTCSIYQLKITDKQYIKLRNEIEVFKQNKDDYSYNFLGLLAAAVNIPVRMKQRYFCSQFVAYVLERSDIKIFNKNYALVKPRDIRLNPRLKSIYRGKLAEYRLTKEKSLVIQ